MARIADTRTSGHPVNYRDKLGNWQPIDSTLTGSQVPGYAYQNRANSFQALFKKTLADGYLRLVTDGQPISLTLAGASGAGATVSGTTIEYRDALPHVTARYSVGSEAVEETLVLQDRAAAPSYRFLLQVPAGTAADQLPDGGWGFRIPGRAQPSFILTPPVAYDSAPGRGLDPRNHHARIGVREVAGGFQVDLTIDQAWLGDPARRFPVFLDPTISIQPDAVTLNQPAVLHSNGAELSWSQYTGPSGAPFQSYQVHRSPSPNFTPGASTLVTATTDVAVTRYRDTTAAPNTTFYYAVVANSSKSNEVRVTLPADGHASMTLQPGPADGAATDIQYYTGYVNCANYGASPDLWIGSDASDVFRTLDQFNLAAILAAIPAGATGISAQLSLWQLYGNTNALTLQAYPVTSSWKEGSGTATRRRARETAPPGTRRPVGSTGGPPGATTTRGPPREPPRWRPAAHRPRRAPGLARPRPGRSKGVQVRSELPLATLTRWVMPAGGRTLDYQYDELGRLWCVTTTAGSIDDCGPSIGATPSPRLVQDYEYDYLDRLQSYRAFSGGTSSTVTDSSTYVHDALDRQVSETENHPNLPARTTVSSYLGLGGQVTEEQLSSNNTTTEVKDYAYDPSGHRLSFTDTPYSGGSPGSPTTYSYGYNVHGSVSQLVDPSGGVKASYGYKPCGSPDSPLTRGDTDQKSPLNPFRYEAKHFDSGSSSYNTGARQYSADSNHFLTADVYHGALANLGLSGDLLTQDRYALAGGNPLSFIEWDGHMLTADGGGGGDSSPAPTGYSSGSGSSGSGSASSQANNSDSGGNIFEQAWN